MREERNALPTDKQEMRILINSYRSSQKKKNLKCLQHGKQLGCWGWPRGLEAVHEIIHWLKCI